MSILIVDGNNICMRAFHTPQGDLQTKAGEPTGVMLGMLNSLKVYLDKFPEVEKVIVTFDAGKSKWRKELYPDYKAQRDYGNEDPKLKLKFDGLWKQIDILVEFLPKFGVSTVKVKGQEADDLMAGICRSLPDTNKMLVTTDKDFFQLLDDKTCIYSPSKERVISPLNFFEESKGITQKAYMGYKALIGDDSDNITGVPGIGETTAKNLMDKYGHIDNVLNATGKDKADLIKSARTKKIFEPANLAILGRNNKLMNFKYVNYQDFQSDINKVINETLQVDTVAVKEFLMRWQFVSILSNYLCFILPFKTLGMEN